MTFMRLTPFPSQTLPDVSGGNPADRLDTVGLHAMLAGMNASDAQAE
ncbi:hypothetical protein AB6869_05690 [Rahnella rivi]